MLLPCAATTHALARLDGRRERLVPEREEPGDRVLEALGQGQFIGREAGVAGVVAGEAGVGRFERGRGDVVGPPPDLDLVLAELGGGLRLVQPLKGAVVALVEPPVVADREPHQVHLVEHDPEGADRPLEHGDVGEVERRTPALSGAGRPSSASSRPRSERSTSVQPVNRFSWFQTLSPCRIRTSLCISGSWGRAGSGPPSLGQSSGRILTNSPIPENRRFFRIVPRPIMPECVGRSSPGRRRPVPKHLDRGRPRAYRDAATRRDDRRRHVRETPTRPRRRRAVHGEPAAAARIVAGPDARPVGRDRDAPPRPAPRGGRVPGRDARRALRLAGVHVGRGRGDGAARRDRLRAGGEPGRPLERPAALGQGRQGAGVRRLRAGGGLPLGAPVRPDGPACGASGGPRGRRSSRPSRRP